MFGGRGPAPRTVVLWGNCQVPVLAERLALLADLNDDYRFVVANRAPDLSTIDPATLPEPLLRDAALLLEQYEMPDVPNPGRTLLRERLGAACPVVTFPSFVMNSMWPFECPDPRCTLDPRFPYNRYQGDFLALQVAHQGLRGPAAVAAYLDLSTRKMPNLEVRLDRDLRRMRHYDAHCDVRLADFVERTFRQEHLFGTWGHVSGRAVNELVQRVMDAARSVVGGSADHLMERIDGRPGMALQAPIHPVVAERLGLAFWRPDLAYRWYDQAWTFHEYMERSINFDTSW